ncbi:MAG TPA: NAD-dependent epimerase/dehydratase family protein [Methylomusa anaerophila]|uniref:UDP-glucose 4-epimerase n=1 Tax=Methylomusa anaerophila TaxID=1930071 RepID=A0A348AQF0_9FIRM|nr:NAD-dependent epimerase/dehydratase family protein [Methylomusa anaerophila]BBB93298.1 UDP-glucose 4-epimerase [Methylomusa anaerophila]HML86871.1 NAD-dependent epimerase/dehydratase family protein [Methylomusa anaerophila]
MKVLVTGGAGFIGSHVIDILLSKGCQVVIIDNLSTGLRENINNRAKFIEMDILSDQILNVFQQEKFDHVIHLAAQTTVAYSLEHPDEDCNINIAGTVQILEACRKTQVRRVVFASSAAVYGDTTQLPITENAPIQPSSFYGLSKWTVECYLSLYHRFYGLNYAALRFANVYGERQGDRGEGGVISIFIRKIQQNEPVNIFGDGGQTRDFIYAGDVAEAIYLALINPQMCLNRVYNISTQTQTSVNTLVEILSQASGKTVKKVYGPPRDGDIYHSMLDNSAALYNLGWKPKLSLAAGLHRTYLSKIGKMSKN